MEYAVLVSAIVFIAAILRGMTGFGFAAAAVPGLSMFLSPATAVSVAIVMQCVIGLRDTVAMRHLIERRSLALLSVGALVGTPVGIWLLTRLPVPTMRILIATLVICGLAAIALHVRLPEHRSTALMSGLVAGVFSGLAAMPGPPAIAYYLGTQTAAVTARASLMIFFFITSSLALPGLLIAGQIDLEILGTSAIAFPAFLLGSWLGGLTFRRLGERGYRSAALGLMVFAALMSGAKGVAELMAG